MCDRSDITCSRFPDLSAVKAFLSEGKALVGSSREVSVVEVDGIVIKFGTRVRKSEVMAMRLVRSATTVPQSTPMLLCLLLRTSPKRY